MPNGSAHALRSAQTSPSRDRLSERPWPPPSDAMATARRVLAEEFPDGLLCHADDFYAWTGTVWELLTSRDIEATVYLALEGARFDGKDGNLEPWRPNRKKVADVLAAVKAITLLPSDKPPPCWLSDAPGLPPVRDLIPLKNGLLNTRTRDLLPHDKRLFSTHLLPFDYRVDDAACQWQAFLESLWPDDPDSINALGEMVGYLVSGRTDLQKIGLIVGPPRSGKGVLLRTLAGLLGPRNTVAPSLASLTTNFGIGSLIQKSAALIGDARFAGSRSETHTLTERLLSISGEDSVTIDRKHREHWTGQLPTRFVICSNEAPRLTDASGALASRLLTFRLTLSFLGREDLELAAKLRRELSGILNWALEGLDRLNERGRFEPPESGLAIVQQVEDVASPVGAFVRECCTVTPNASVSADVLWDAWVDWCSAEHRREGTKAEFGRQLKAVLPEIRKTRSRAAGRGAVYQGVGLRAEETEEADEEPDPFPEVGFMELKPVGRATPEDVKALFGGEIRDCPPDCVH